MLVCDNCEGKDQVERVELTSRSVIYPDQPPSELVGAGADLCSGCRVSASNLGLVDGLLATTKRRRRQAQP